MDDPIPFDQRCANFSVTSPITQEQISAYGACRGVPWHEPDGCAKNQCARLPSMTMLYELHINLPLELTIYGTIFPALVLLAVVANIFVVLVLSKPHMKSPTNTVIVYMALAEMLVGLVPLCFYFHYYNLGAYRHVDDQLQLHWCYMHKFLTDTLPPIAHNVANWLTVLLAVQRFISIQYPIQSRKWIRVENVRRATVVIVVVSLLNGLQKTFDYHMFVYEGYRLFPKANSTPSHADSTGGANASGVEMEWRRFRTCARTLTGVVMRVSPVVYFNFYFWTRCIVFIMIPCVSLIVFNVLLIKGIRKAQLRKERLLRENRTREAQRATESNTTSIMLVVIVSIFLLVNFPQALFIAVLCVNITFKLQLAALNNPHFSNVFLLISNMLIIFAYPINFAIYCSMSGQFRQTFKRLFCVSPLVRSSQVPSTTPLTLRRSMSPQRRRSGTTIAGSSRPPSDDDVTVALAAAGSPRRRSRTIGSMDRKGGDQTNAGATFLFRQSSNGERVLGKSESTDDDDRECHLLLRPPSSTEPSRQHKQGTSYMVLLSADLTPSDDGRFGVGATTQIRLEPADGQKEATVYL